MWWHSCPGGEGTRAQRGPTYEGPGTSHVHGLVQSSVPKSKAVTSKERGLTSPASTAMPPKQAGNFLFPFLLEPKGFLEQELGSSHRHAKSQLLPQRPHSLRNC